MATEGQIVKCAHVENGERCAQLVIAHEGHRLSAYCRTHIPAHKKERNPKE